MLEALETFARGVVNETMERHTFNNRTQEDGEKFDEYLTEIKLLSKNCNFCNQCYESLLRDRIVGGIKCDITRQKLRSEKDLTLKKAEEICRASEKARQGMNAFKKNGKVEQEEIAYTRSRGDNKRSDEGMRFKPFYTSKQQFQKPPCIINSVKKPVLLGVKGAILAA